ncbi:MAG: NYN domain-containing protein [Solirubrobacterales bacterium]|nr:NYN domain-containing protein [Solirubrobacterales bacterium]
MQSLEGGGPWRRRDAAIQIHEITFIPCEDVHVAASDTTRLAVLIDSDNVTASVTTELLAEIAKYGTPTIKRAYGDWTTPDLGGWKEELLRHAIQPFQQFAYTRGKNATDSALIIDAMDLLYAGNLEGFVIVSSDSDFTRLATRLRESGMTVYGLGQRKTPAPFVAACDRFIYLDLLKSELSEAAQPADKQAYVEVRDVPLSSGLSQLWVRLKPAAPESVRAR